MDDQSALIRCLLDFARGALDIVLFDFPLQRGVWQSELAGSFRLIPTEFGESSRNNGFLILVGMHSKWHQLRLGHGGANFRRKEIFADLTAGVENRQPLDDIAQFANVAGPGVIGHSLPSAARELRNSPNYKLLHEVLDQWFEVFGTFTQRRDVDCERANAIKEVLAKSASFHHFLEIAIRRCDQPEIDFLGHLAANDADFLFLKHSQQFCLHTECEFTDFVKEKRAAVGELDFADSFVNAGCNSLFDSEEFSLHYFAGVGSTIERDKRSIAIRAALVDNLSQDFFAGAAFAKQKDRCFGISDAGQLLNQVDQDSAARDELLADAERFMDGVQFRCAPLRDVELARLREDDSDEVRNGCDKFVFVFGEHAGQAVVIEIEHADNVLAGDKRHASDGINIVLDNAAILAREIVSLGITDDERGLVFKDRVHDAAAHRENIFEGYLVAGDETLNAQIGGVICCEQQSRAFGAGLFKRKADQVVGGDIEVFEGIEELGDFEDCLILGRERAKGFIQAVEPLARSFDPGAIADQRDKPQMLEQEPAGELGFVLA